MMMNRECGRIAEQLRRAFEGEAWHGPAFFEVVDSIDGGTAVRRPAAGVHSILELVNHVEAWLSIARRRVAGETLPPISTAMDWPAPEGERAGAWEAACGRLRTSYGELRALIETLEDANLDTRAPGPARKYTNYEELHGAVQHSLYHLGQIVILARDRGRSEGNS